MATSAVFIDLDRTLLCQASGQVLNRAMVEEGVLPKGRSLPGDRLLYAVNDRLGENLFSMGLVRAAAAVARGWRQDQVQAAGRRAVAGLSELVAPFAPQHLSAFRAEGHKLVLSTTTPADMIAPFAEALGFDDLIATTYEVRDGRYTGRLYEGFVWGTGKLRAVREWARTTRRRPLRLPRVQRQHLRRPAPLERRARRTPSTRTRRSPWWRRRGAGRWSTGTARPACPTSSASSRTTCCGRSSARCPSPTPASTSAASSTCRPAARCSWPRTIGATSTSPRWPWWRGEIGRPVRFLGKKEIFDAPVVGQIARAIGGIPVDRGSGSDQPLRAAESALKAGEVVIVLPQGTIPRGYDFFDPVLHGKTGTARLAASTGATVVPVGLWGTEKVWPRSARLPDFTLVRKPPKVTVRVGAPLSLSLADAKADTAMIMKAISALLPAESRVRHEPTPEELARTKPPR